MMKNNEDMNSNSRTNDDRSSSTPRFNSANKHRAAIYCIRIKEH